MASPSPVMPAPYNIYVIYLSTPPARPPARPAGSPPPPSTRPRPGAREARPGPIRLDTIAAGRLPSRGTPEARILPRAVERGHGVGGGPQVHAGRAEALQWERRPARLYRLPGKGVRRHPQLPVDRGAALRALRRRRLDGRAGRRPPRRGGVRKLPRGGGTGGLTAAPKSVRTFERSDVRKSPRMDPASR